MTIRIVCAGKLKEKSYLDLSAEYIKRLSRFATVEVNEVPDEKIPDNAGEAEEAHVKEKEGSRLLSHISSQDYVIALTLDGKSYTSESFASHLDQLLLSGKSRLTFVIGGSLGLSPEVISRADEKLSLSAMTFPHRLARIILLEQVYRAFKIRSNETYHK